MATSRTPIGSIVDAVQLPHVVRIRPNLYVVAFTLMKLLPARFMLDRAEQRGELEPGVTVLESSSGTFGLGLAMVCRLRGYALTIVSDPATDRLLRRRLELLGARVEICPEPSPSGGFQQARLDRLDELRQELSRHYVPGQYWNPDNPASYASVAERLAEAIGPPDCLVGAVGSGGSTCGVAGFLRLVVPELRLVGVDTPGSAIFGQPDRPRILRGLGNSLVPPNVTHEAYDEVHWLGAAEAFHATQELYARHCLYMGPTSGAAFLVADWWARNNPEARVVALLPDEGHRYQQTVYSDEWLDSVGLLRVARSAAPVHIDHPTDPATGWAAMSWGRRRLDDVLGTGVAA